MLSNCDYPSRRKVILLSYKFLALGKVSFGKLSFESFKVGDFKLFNKYVFKDLIL